MNMAVTSRFANVAVNYGSLLVRVVTASVLSIGASSVKADGFNPLDQFIVTAIPAGIELQPRDQTLNLRSLTYDPRQISNEQLIVFAQNICQTDTPNVQTLRQTWLQWLGNQTPARITC